MFYNSCITIHFVQQYSYANAMSIHLETLRPSPLVRRLALSTVPPISAAPDCAEGGSAPRTLHPGPDQAHRAPGLLLRVTLTTLIDLTVAPTGKVQRAFLRTVRRGR